MNCESGDTCLVVGACLGHECSKAAIGKYVVKVTFIAPYLANYIEVLDGRMVPALSEVWFIEGPPKPCPIGKPGCPGMSHFPDDDLQPLNGKKRGVDKTPDPVQPEPYTVPTKTPETSIA